MLKEGEVRWGDAAGIDEAEVEMEDTEAFERIEASESVEVVHWAGEVGLAEKGNRVSRSPVEEEELV